jgi:tetratricopeptide (TPR) repeat protein
MKQSILFFCILLLVSTLVAEEALFSVTNNSTPPDTIFAVYPSGIKVLNEAGSKVFIANSDSVRIYVNEDEERSSRGGFAVGGVASRSMTEYLRVTPDSVRVYVDSNPTRSSRGGFAVGGVASRNNEKYFDVTPHLTPETINPSEPRMLWYPSKEAFRVGKVLIADPDSVGTNSIATGFESKAIGDWSQAFGYQSRALGDYSTAIGYKANARENHSFAVGDSAQALGADSFALGFGARAEGRGSFAFGSVPRDSLGNIIPGFSPVNSIGDYSLTFGLGSTATGIASMAMGMNTESHGFSSFSAGLQTVADGSGAVALGRSTEAAGYGSTALGIGSEAAEYGTVAAGSGCHATGYASTAIGRNANALGDGSTALGAFTYARGNNSFAAGNYSQANEDGAIAIGEYCLSDAFHAFSAGRNCDALGQASIAMGSYSEALNEYSIAMGRNNNANGDYAVAIGYGCEADSVYSVAIGGNCTASGRGSVSLGEEATSTGAYSFAANRASEANGEYSTALVSATTTGDYSFAVGRFSEATGNYATAIGQDCLASGGYATAIGYDAVASGTNSVAIGNDAQATNSDCIAIGNDVIAAGGNIAIGNNINTGNTTSGSMLFADDAYGTALASTGMNQFKSRFQGGYTLHTNISYTPENSFYIKNDGKVGIGNEYPEHKVDITDTVDNTDGDEGTFINIENNADGNDIMCGIRFKNGSDYDTYKGGIFYNDSSTYGRGDIVFANRSAIGSTDVDINDDTRMIVKNNGYIGIGTSQPVTLLALAGTNSSNGITLGHDQTVPVGIYHTADAMVVTSPNSKILFGTSEFIQDVGSYKINLGSTGATKVGIDNPNPSYPLHLSGGAYCSGSTWVNASSRALKEDIEYLTLQEAKETLDELNPVKFKYISEENEKHVGFIAEDVPELVATKDRKGLASMDVVAVLTKIVQEQQDKIEELEQRLNKLAE